MIIIVKYNYNLGEFFETIAMKVFNEVDMLRNGFDDVDLL